MAGAFESYLRHGRKFAIDSSYWEAAASNLHPVDLRRLAAELDVDLPARWANRRNEGPDPAPQAGLTANKSGGPTDGSRGCRSCGRPSVHEHDRAMPDLLPARVDARTEGRLMAGAKLVKTRWPGIYKRGDRFAYEWTDAEGKRRRGSATLTRGGIRAQG